MMRHGRFTVTNKRPRRVGGSGHRLRDEGRLRCGCPDRGEHLRAGQQPQGRHRGLRRRPVTRPRPPPRHASLERPAGREHRRDGPPPPQRSPQQRIPRRSPPTLRSRPQCGPAPGGARDAPAPTITLVSGNPGRPRTDAPQRHADLRRPGRGPRSSGATLYRYELLTCALDRVMDRRQRGGDDPLGPRPSPAGCYVLRVQVQLPSLSGWEGQLSGEHRTGQRGQLGPPLARRRIADLAEALLVRGERSRSLRLEPPDLRRRRRRGEPLDPARRSRSTAWATGVLPAGRASPASTASSGRGETSAPASLGGAPHVPPPARRPRPPPARRWLPRPRAAAPPRPSLRRPRRAARPPRARPSGAQPGSNPPSCASAPRPSS